MKNYKPVLRVSLKPEAIVKKYLLVIACIGIFCAINISIHKLLICCLLALYLKLIYKNWLHYYCLSSKRSVRLFQLDANDEASVENDAGERTSVRIINILRLEIFSNVLLIIYFQKKSKPISEKLFSLGLSRMDRLRQYFWEKQQSMLIGISDFLALKRQVFIISEKSLGEDEFRELVRRINVIH